MDSRWLDLFLCGVSKKHLTKYFRLVGKHCHLGVLLGPFLGEGILAESAGAVGCNSVWAQRCCSLLKVISWKSLMDSDQVQQGLHIQFSVLCSSVMAFLHSSTRNKKWFPSSENVDAPSHARCCTVCVICRDGVGGLV